MRSACGNRPEIHRPRPDESGHYEHPMSEFEALNRRIVRCRRCPRLRQWCESIARVKRRAFADEAYWGRPVPNFGDPHARLLIVGLAPAAHGANRTGRMFTGD